MIGKPCALVVDSTEISGFTGLSSRYPKTSIKKVFVLLVFFLKKFSTFENLKILGITVTQVVDDILDITATTEELGKTAGKDLATDKTTYPSILGLEKSREVSPVVQGPTTPEMVGKIQIAPFLSFAQ